MLDELRVDTICREARCPNRIECYSAGTASFLILGATCTRRCRFCSVDWDGAGASTVSRIATADRLLPGAPSTDEPQRVAESAARLRLRHAVITSVTRDDLPDGGASQFAATVEAIHLSTPGATVEVLIPDLGGDRMALHTVLAARPDVLAHNLETVPRLYWHVRPKAKYRRSLDLLARAAAWARSTTVPPGGAARAPRRPQIKSGLMLGLGEHSAEVHRTMSECVAAGVDVLTIGQYLQPRRDCLPVVRYVTPEEFSTLERLGETLGILVRAAPFVRSSYRAAELLSAASRPTTTGPSATGE